MSEKLNTKQETTSVDSPWDIIPENLDANRDQSNTGEVQQQTDGNKFSPEALEKAICISQYDMENFVKAGNDPYKVLEKVDILTCFETFKVATELGIDPKTAFTKVSAFMDENDFENFLDYGFSANEILESGPHEIFKDDAKLLIRAGGDLDLVLDFLIDTYIDQE